MTAVRTRACAYCGRSFSTPSRRGPAPLYCCPSHRQAAYVVRLRERAEATPSSVVDEIADMRRRLDLLEARVTTDTPAGAQPPGSPRPEAPGAGQAARSPQPSEEW